MGIEGQLTAKSYTLESVEVLCFTSSAKPHSFDLEQQHLRETVVDLRDIDICTLYLRHPEGSRSSAS